MTTLLNETELLKDAKNGDEQAKEMIVSKYDKMVYSILYKFKFQEDHKDDLMQAGYYGLLKAIENFSFTKGVLFSTYAHHTIYNFMKTYISSNKPVKISRKVKHDARIVRDFKQNYFKTNEENPTFSEILEATNLTSNELVDALNMTKQPYSLDYSINEESDEKELSFQDLLTDDMDLENLYITKSIVRQAINQLNQKEKQIIYYKFYQDIGQEDIGKKMGISQAQISRIQKKALDKIKSSINKGEKVVT